MDLIRFFRSNGLLPGQPPKQHGKQDGNEPTNIHVPKILLKYQIAGTKTALAAREEELEAALQADKDPKLIENQINELREELRIANEGYEKR